MTLMIGLIAVAAVFVALSFADASRAHAAEGGEPKHTNALAGESSPYLLQHAHNPGNWRPWGAAALALAKREDKPIFLSVGYSTCHWCHVMAHESFEDEQVAALLNEHFICIKVDREELPDVDEQYMLATQLFTRRGGWPNSVFLTPDGRPWYAGTYFPKPQFMQLLSGLADVWKNKRDDVEKQANGFAEAIRQAGRQHTAHGEHALEPELIDRAIRYFQDAYDQRHGGFGSAPKFPPHGALALLAHRLRQRPDLVLQNVFTHTLDAMMLGGMYDHVGGGFHRYSTDARWFLPHFEKMLYDNAQLIGVYADGYAMTGAEDYRRVIDQTFDWVQREMTDERGGFYSALDADSEGEEGKFYVWTLDEVIDALGEDDGKAFAEAYHMTREGTYIEEATRQRTGANIPHLTEPIGDDATRQRLDALRRKLLEVRAKRVRPGLDDKVLTGWNGLMISTLARAGRELKDERYTKAAARAADFILQHMRDGEGELLRVWRDGVAKQPAYLDDYAYLIDGLLELHTTTSEAKWRKEAAHLADRMIAEFHDAKLGGFFFTQDDHEALLMRSKQVGAGGNTPGANGVAASVLTRLATLTDEARYATLAAETFKEFSGMMASQPHGSEALVLAFAEYLDAAEAHPALALREKIESATPASDADAFAEQGPVRVEAYASRNVVQPGATLHLAVRITIDEGYHIYAHDVDPETKLLPTTITVDGQGFDAGAIRWPESKRVADPILKAEIAMYDGVTTAVVPMTVDKEAAAGDHTLGVSVRAQACDDRACLPPQRYDLKLPVRIDADADQAARHANLFESLGVK